MKLPHSIRIALTTLVLCLAGGEVAAEVVAVVSARSPVSNLSRAQIVDIFLGKARRFPDGTTALPIDLAEGEAERDEFYTKFAAKSPAQIKAYWSKIIFTGRGQPPAAAANPQDLRKRIAGNPAAIGYIDRAWLDSSVKAIE
jgi:ABC-type phosphate transport system substrate-binding protein